MAQKISIVIVSYNVCQLLDECLQSVERALEGVDGDIYVVDNNSSDGSVETLRPKHPQVCFIANKDNVGFARANNQAIRQQKLKSGDHIQVGRTTFIFEAKEIKKSAN